MYLNDVKNSEYYVVDEINLSEKTKRRLYDIGLVTGTKIKLLFESPSKRIKGYLVRGSIIAIRNTDAQFMKVSELND